MEIFDKILDLPVIVQGALGSLLFWLFYEASKFLVNWILTLASKYSRRLRKELKMHEAFHHAHSLFDLSSPSNSSVHLVSLFGATNRLIRAAIYICIGLISEHFLGPISSVAYLIAIGYLFLALKAAHVDFEGRMPKAERAGRFKVLADEVLGESRNSGKKATPDEAA